ncbi:hypothetical protein [Enterobacter hormaechei]|uniref:hypothetical protein n=1 Tax=Enterobacter hormaechei TaxID=158836 RepID=UPI00079B92B6|nr:hypothetical protein [Enterobacter hormaechei]SAF94430.1 Uncharacterised protein [Enterobacter hormaechei]VAG11635.1 Uncharacterised protein [Enterobacter hormaechei]DAL65916.1 MAG TPA_asm: hypothetical protein [Caudoviricetes sp.]
MPSKLKQRRTRRLKADVAWWKGEASDLYTRVMEQADEIAELRRLVIRVPMPVVVPESVADELKLREVG